MMKWFVYFMRRLDGNGRLCFPSVYDLGEVTLLVSDVSHCLETAVGQQHEVAPVCVLAAAGLGVPVQATMQGVAHHVLEGVVGYCLWARWY